MQDANPFPTIRSGANRIKLLLINKDARKEEEGRKYGTEAHPRYEIR